jgi:hypothetical protein
MDQVKKQAEQYLKAEARKEKVRDSVTMVVMVLLWLYLNFWKML